MNFERALFQKIDQLGDSRYCTVLVEAKQLRRRMNCTDSFINGMQFSKGWFRRFCSEYNLLGKTKGHYWTADWNSKVQDNIEKKEMLDDFDIKLEPIIEF